MVWEALLSERILTYFGIEAIGHTQPLESMNPDVLHTEKRLGSMLAYSCIEVP